ncbi:MAG: tetratricopeptide repeat protein [Longimicrobiales bacterium]
MPEQREQLAEAIRYLHGGALDAALARFRDLSAEPQNDPDVRAAALRGEADVHRIRSNWGEALAAAERSCAVARDGGLSDGHAEGLNACAITHIGMGDYGRAGRLLEQVLETAGDERIRGLAHENLGYIAASQGDFACADRHFGASIESFEAAGYERGVAIALTNRSQALLDRGDPAAAEDAAERAIRAARLVNDLYLVGSALINLSEAVALQGDLDRAADLASEAFGQLLTIGDRAKQVEALRRLGDLHRRRGNADVAERCYRQGLDLARDIGARVEAEALADSLEELEGAGQ